VLGALFRGGQRGKKLLDAEGSGAGDLGIVIALDRLRTLDVRGGDTRRGDVDRGPTLRPGKAVP